MPVKYIKRGNFKRPDNPSYNEDGTVSKNDSISKPAKLSILQADRKKYSVSCFDRTSTNPNTEDGVPTSVEPQPRTTICYKPSTELETKARSTSPVGVNKEQNIADIVRSIQGNFEARSHNDNSSCDEKSYADTRIWSAAIPSQQHADTTIGQTYNLDLFRRIVGKSQSQVKTKENEKLTKHFPIECKSRLHDSGSSSAWLNWMMKSSQTQRNCAEEQYSPIQSQTVSQQNLNRYAHVKKCSAIYIFSD